jgi:hydroxymethylpyrimidine pyrophosphatase-like HAD family hydrolase
MKYKLLAADMDGTLLNDESKLTERTKAAVRAAVSAGVLFVTATGRPMCASEEVNALFCDDLPFITFNGAAAVMGKSKKVLFSSFLEAGYVKEIYKLGTEYNVPVIVSSNETLWVSRDGEDVREYQKISAVPVNIVKDIEELEQVIKHIQ